MGLPDKYTTLRNRFFANFYFKGIVAESIDQSVPGGKITFADQTIYMGQALMTLSTEIALLTRAGQAPSDAQGRIEEILDTFDELDLNGEKYLSPQAQGVLDGFFVRDDIIGLSDSRLGGRFAQVTSDWQDPQNGDASPSGDQLFGMMDGLLCVVRYSGDSSLRDHAKAISSRLYGYANRSSFDLKMPSGNSTPRGSDVRWLASLLHGLNKTTTGDDLFSSSKISVGPVNLPIIGNVGPVELPLNGVAAFWSDSNTPSQVANLTGTNGELTILKQPVFGHELDLSSPALHSFALHMLLMALAPGDVWSQSDLEMVAIKCNHHLSILLYCQIHSTSSQTFHLSDIQSVLDACPEDGPKASLNPTTGWGTANRWVRCANIFDADGGNEQYNGLDWLILQNLVQLVYDS